MSAFGLGLVFFLVLPLAVLVLLLSLVLLLVLILVAIHGSSSKNEFFFAVFRFFNIPGISGFIPGWEE